MALVSEKKDNSISEEGACHCGTVKFRIKAPLPLSLVRCNCSICRMTGFLHLFVDKDGLEILEGEDNLQLYQFGSKTAKHLFCKTCGVKSFYVPRSHPDGWSINANCLTPEVRQRAHYRDFDGVNWEQNIAGLRAEDA